MNLKQELRPLIFSLNDKDSLEWNTDDYLYRSIIKQNLNLDILVI